MGSSRYKVYPKEFRWERIPIERNRVFVLMPFAQEMDEVYGTLKDALTNSGYACSRADELDGSTLVMATILREIMRSRYIIADLTTLNPNVFYELGIAHSFKDLPNVVMIKRKGDKSPFDISHLRYIEYDATNLFLLKSKVLEALRRGSSLTDFQETLNKRGILDMVSEGRDDFVDLLQEHFDYDLEGITALLNGEIDLSAPSEVYLSPISQVRSLLVSTMQMGRTNIMDGLVRVYGEMIASAPGLSDIEGYVTECLETLFDPYEVPDEQIDAWKIDFAITVATHGSHMVRVLPFLIGYLKRIKTMHIDLNRYRVERFLLLSSDSRVNEGLINALGDSDRHIREYAADIIGDKRLVAAHDYLLCQLDAETNIYTARSMFRTLGRIGAATDVQFIVDWVDKREDSLRRNMATIVIRHAYHALRELTKGDSSLADEFHGHYADMIDDLPLS